MFAANREAEKNTVFLMPTIFDNIEQHLETGLNRTLAHATRADFCIGYFNLRGWDRICEQVEGLPGAYLPEEYDDEALYHCRVLVGMQKRPDDLIRDFFARDHQRGLDNAEALQTKKRLAQAFKDQLTIGIPTNRAEEALRRLSQQLKDGKVVVKLYLKNLHAKLYLAFRDDYNSPVIGFVGSSNLTFAGISKQGELNVDVVEQDAAKKLARWFQDRWQDRWCVDISQELIEIIDNSWAAERLYSPYHIYLKMAYHLSREARAGISEFTLPKAFRDRLFPYQASAVKVAAHHLYKRGGVMIGDVVGLGKTITASALAKIFEDDHFLETLIICPKNLVAMWEEYTHTYRLRAAVLSITQVAKLRDERRYRLLIIDESHNLRNREGKRYQAVLDYIQRNDSKVILLTATPYNKSYHDLANQLRLFLDDDQDLGIRPERFIESVGGRTQFQANYQAGESTLAAFEKSPFSEDWSELMRLFLVRRTRSFIKHNYARIDPQNGRYFLEFPDGTSSYFPERRPRRVDYDFNPDDPTDQYARLYSQEVVQIIDRLHLPRYGLGQEQYRHPAPAVRPTAGEIKIQQNLGRAGARLKGFARTNLFKRLESSGYAFLLSVSRHILRNVLFMHAIEHHRPLPVGTQEAGLIDAYMFSDADTEENAESGLLFSLDAFREQAREYYEFLATQQREKYQWIRSELFSPALLQSLHHDSEALLTILQSGKAWSAAQDRKLNALYTLCRQTHAEEKLLIFTQYSDTAAYILDGLTARGVRNSACVTGETENPTAIVHRFSPRSSDGLHQEGEELRILITTDVLSEGQNLQDAHIIVNYDLPWAIIRLIQRAGRVDRIGQKSPVIYCYSFLPEEGIEAIINLRERLRRRIKENAETIGSDETFFEGDPVNIRDLYNEKAGVFDDEDDVEVDLASYAYQIWKNATDADPQLEKIIPDLPDVVYAAKHAPYEIPVPGAIVYTKTAGDNDMLAWVNAHEEIVTQSQFEILKAARCAADEPPLERAENHHELVEIGVKHIKKVESRVGGQLGKKSGARYKTYMRLSRYAQEHAGTLFVTDELKRAIEAIYSYPLREYAREALNRQLKLGISDIDLVKLVVSLREDGKLSIIQDDDERDKAPRIICSMGLKK